MTKVRAGAAQAVFEAAKCFIFRQGDAEWILPKALTWCLPGNGPHSYSKGAPRINRGRELPTYRYSHESLLYHDCIKTRANFQTGQGGSQRRCGHISDETIARELRVAPSKVSAAYEIHV